MQADVKRGVCEAKLVSPTISSKLKNLEGFLFFLHAQTKLPLEPAAAAPSASGQRRCYHPLFIPEPSPPRTGSCDFSSHSSSPTPKTRARLHRTSDVRHTAAFGVAATTASRLSLATTWASPWCCSCSSFALVTLFDSSVILCWVIKRVEFRRMRRVVQWRRVGLWSVGL